MYKTENSSTSSIIKSQQIGTVQCRNLDKIATCYNDIHHYKRCDRIGQNTANYVNQHYVN